MKRNTKTIAQAIAEGDLHDGDVLLFRAAMPIGWLISKLTQSDYAHAAMVGWWAADYPFCLETREWIGSRAVTLESQVAWFSDKIDVFRVTPTAFPSGKRWESLRSAVRHMRRATGRHYGWWNVLRAALRRLPVVRFFCEPNTNDQAVGSALPYCSELVDQALRAAGVDACPNKAGRLTEPGDLATSAALEYRYTLKKGVA